MPTDEGYPSIDDLPEDSDQIQECYARFGLAMYYAQVLEANLINLIWFHEMLAGRFTTPQDLDARRDDLWTRTLGSLLKIGGTGPLATAEDAVAFRNALAARNRLAHRFWWEAAELMMTTRGREQVLSDLDGNRHVFREVEDRVRRMLLTLGGPRGLTDERITAEMHRIMTDLGAPPTDRPDSTSATE